MRRSLTYPKDNDRKLRETVKQLKMQVGQLRKENNVLRNEISNMMKPVRTRKEPIESKKQPMMTQEEWRREFINRFKPKLDKRLEEIKNHEDDEDT